jgi:hypothetical protein
LGAGPAWSSLVEAAAGVEVLERQRVDKGFASATDRQAHAVPGASNAAPAAPAPAASPATRRLARAAAADRIEKEIRGSFVETHQLARLWPNSDGQAALTLSFDKKKS